jgi:hypothetical protein
MIFRMYVKIRGQGGGKIDSSPTGPEQLNMKK